MGAEGSKVRTGEGTRHGRQSLLDASLITQAGDAVAPNREGNTAGTTGVRIAARGEGRGKSNSAQSAGNAETIGCIPFLGVGGISRIRGGWVDTVGIRAIDATTVSHGCSIVGTDGFSEEGSLAG